MNVEEAVKEIRDREEIFVAYSRMTNLPYVSESEESFNDQVWLFADEEKIKEFGKKMLEEKVVLMGMKYLKKDFPRLYGLLYSIGVDGIVWNSGEERIEIELEQIAKEPDMSKVDPAKRPLINPTLQLSGIYFMQELRKPVKDETPQQRNERLHELDEQLVANLRKSEFLVALNKREDEPGKVDIPYLKDKNGNMMQPVFTDVLEFQKFARGKKLNVAKVPCAKLPEVLLKQAEALVINPLGFNLPLKREQLEKICGVQTAK